MKLNDWRLATNYEHIRHYNRRQWAWEFLRRNTAYQRTWEEAVHTYLSNKNNLDETPDGLKGIWREKFIIVEHSNLVRKTTSPNISVLYVDGIDLWGAPILANPMENEPSSYFMPNGWFHVGEMHPLYESLKLEPPSAIQDRSADFIKTQILIPIDIYLPLKPQLDFFGAMLRQVQKEHKLPKRPVIHPNSWIYYLRVLDAVAEVTPRRIAAPIIFGKSVEEAFDPVERKWDETLKQAQKMLNKGYKNLL